MKYQLLDTRTNEFGEVRLMTPGESAKLNAEFREQGRPHLGWVREWENDTIKVLVPYTWKVETFRLVGQGKYPYDCPDADKHPDSLIYVSESGGWVPSHDLTYDAENDYFIIGGATCPSKNSNS